MVTPYSSVTTPGPYRSNKRGLENPARLRAQIDSAPYNLRTFHGSSEMVSATFLALGSFKGNRRLSPQEGTKSDHGET